jgi:hypothetical protein
LGRTLTNKRSESDKADSLLSATIFLAFAR